MPERVRITDVSPRDGLQNEAGVIPTADKVRLVELLSATGVDEVEITSFVSAKWVPQLGDAKELLRSLSEHAVHGSLVRPWPAFSALVPNKFGMDEVIQLQLEGDVHLLSKVSVFTAASETFNRKNTNATIAESIERFKTIVQMVKEGSEHPNRVELNQVRGYVSCVIACPFEGPIAPDKVVDVVEQLIDIGVDEVDLGDTIGAATPESLAMLLGVLRRRLSQRYELNWWTQDRLTLHLHDTFGRAPDCVKTALDLGIRSFDGSVAGLGGCPYASTPGKRAPGNIATETLVRTINEAGYETGVDLDKLAQAATFARQIVTASRAGASS